MYRRFFVVVIALVGCLTSAADASCGEARRDRPTVVLDQLTFPVRMGSKRYERTLRKFLAREVNNVNWGAPGDSTIEYRFSVSELAVKLDGKVLSVTVAAEGTLPRGKKARSRLTFGGDPGSHHALIERVLKIVARGVIARLAELERVRRGHLPDQGISALP